MSKSLKSLLFLSAFSLFCQVQAAYIGYLYPAGGRAGEEVEILVGGQGLWNAKEVLLTGGGISKVRIENVRGFPHPSGSQRKYLNQWVKRIQNGDRSYFAPPESEELKKDWHKHPWYSKLNELTPLQYELTTHFLYVRRNPLQASPSISQRLIVKFRIDPKASPGMRELRLASGGWVSNPVPFFIGRAPEYNEPRYQPPPSKKTDGFFKYPCALNGQIMPGETDKFDFEAKKGEVITFDLKGRVLQPFVGDGVPGHFQAVLEVQDSSGKKVAFADDRYFHPDPVMTFKVPATGRYKLLVRDALYRGRNDFVYRIEIDKNPRPYIINAPPVFTVSPVKLSEAAKKSTLTAPVVISDCIEKAGVRDEYLFSASAGEKLVADVWARRLNSPLDALIEVFDPDGKRIVVCDDVKRQRIGLVMQHTDPTAMFTAPKSGTYKITVSDNAGAGGRDYRYYLRIDQPRPDFRVYGYPSTLEPGGYGRGIFGVVVERLDGFNGPVKITMRSANNFRICGEKTIPAGCNSASFTIDSMAARKGGRHTVRLEGSANGITHRVIPSTEAMQAFAYTHLIPCSGDFYALKAGGRYWVSSIMNWAERKPAALKLYPASSTDIKITLSKHKLADLEVTGITLKDQPTGISVENVKLRGNVITATVKAASDVKAVTVNQIFLVNVRYTAKYKDKKDGLTKTRKANASGLLPSRRLMVIVPAKAK